MFYLEKNLKGADDTSKIHGVYWSARDLDGSPIGNHHFFTFVYADEGQASRLQGHYPDLGHFVEENDAKPKLKVHFSTFGVSQDKDNNITITFNGTADHQAVHEIASKKNTHWYKSDYDYEGHRLPLDKSSKIYTNHEQLMVDVIGKVKCFLDNYNNGKKVPYTLANENCACFVNSLLEDLNFDRATRVEYGEFQGVDWGEEDEFPNEYFRPIPV